MIREYKQEDSKDLLELFKEFREYGDSEYSEDVQVFEAVKDDADFSGHILSYFTGMRKSTFLVAEKDSKIVGYIVGYIDKKNANKKMEKAGHIKSFFVTADSRGSGIGKKLYQAFIDWCKQEGCDHVSLEVFHGNDKTLEMYKKWGFSEQIVKMKKSI